MASDWSTVRIKAPDWSIGKIQASDWSIVRINAPDRVTIEHYPKFILLQLYPGCSHSPEDCRSKKNAAKNISQLADLSTLEAAVKRKRKDEGIPEPGPSKPPPPHQWSHETFDGLQKKANLTDGQMRIVAQTKR